MKECGKITFWADEFAFYREDGIALFFSWEYVHAMPYIYRTTDFCWTTWYNNEDEKV